MNKYLPIGSIVLLKGGTKRIMIYGRHQKEVKSDQTWDYIACLYPEGNLNEEYMYLFNHDQIEKVFFIGFQDEEEIEFVKEALKSS